jgi:hypothetical protein
MQASTECADASVVDPASTDAAMAAALADCLSWLKLVIDLLHRGDSRRCPSWVSYSLGRSGNGKGSLEPGIDT